MKKYGIVKICPECNTQMEIENGQAKCPNCGYEKEVGCDKI